MPVPNTTNFSFTDVRTELINQGRGTFNDLSAALTGALDSSFDPAYKGSKNSLLNFRNYNAGVATSPISLGRDFNSAQNACLAPTGTYYRLASETGGFNTITKLFANSTGTTNAGADWYSDGTFVRYWNGNSFTINQFCS